MRQALLLPLLFIMLAGCFESEKPLYAGVTPLHPFRDGAVLISHEDGKEERAIVREVTPGAYRFVDAREPGNTRDAPLRFYPLPGGPAGSMVSEGMMDGDCTPRTACKPTYIHMLWRLANGKLEFINPDCSKVTGVAQLAGVTAKDSNCGFTKRATLEQAMRLVVAARLKPDNVITLQP